MQPDLMKIYQDELGVIWGPTRQALSQINYCIYPLKTENAVKLI